MTTKVLARWPFPLCSQLSLSQPVSATFYITLNAPFLYQQHLSSLLHSISSLRFFFPLFLFLIMTSSRSTSHRKLLTFLLHFQHCLVSQYFIQDFSFFLSSPFPFFTVFRYHTGSLAAQSSLAFCDKVENGVSRVHPLCMRASCMYT